MSVVRKQIRNEIVELLKGATSAGDKVFASRINPFDKEDLPVINIYTTSELVSDSGEAPLLNNRTLTVVAEIITNDPTDDALATDKADDIAEQIEQVMFKQDANVKGKLGCLVDSIRLQGIAFEFESQGESAVNSCRLSFAMNYKKEAVASIPENTTDLDRIGAEWDIGTAKDPNPEAEDLIELGA